MEVHRLSKIISAIFDASLVDTGWHILASELVSAFNADKCTFQIRDTITGSMRFVGKTENFDDNTLEDYETWYSNEDSITKKAITSSADKPSIWLDLVIEDEFVQSQFYQNFYHPNDIHHTLCAPVDIGGGCFGVIHIYRSKDGDNFSFEDQRHLSLLLPHVKCAMQINNRVNVMSQGQLLTLSALDQLSLGIIIVGTGGIVRFTNKTIDRMLRSELGIKIRRGHLVLENSTAHQLLQKAIEDAHKAAGGNLFKAGTMIPLCNNFEKPISLLVSPFSSGPVEGWPLGPVAAVFINNPEERRGLREESISKLYALTPAEARLTKALLDGERLQDYAERVGISLHTAKTQLKQVFSKTGHGRQSDLVRDIMSNPILRMRF